MLGFNANWSSPSRMEQVQEIVKQIEKELNKIEPLRIAEQKTGVPKLYLAAGAAVIVALFIWLAFGIEFIVTVATFAYPAIQSVHAAQTKIDVEHWLTYWLIFGAFVVLETFEETLVYYLPLYHYVKLAVLLWAFLPQTLGARVVYHNLILKFAPPANRKDKIEEKVGAAFDSLKAKVTSVVNEDNADRLSREFEKKFE